MSGFRYWANLTWPEFGALDIERTVAVLPVAAIEQHGPHLPLSTDASINRGVLQTALDRLPDSMSILVLPEMPIGKSDEHAAFPGTLTLGTETLMRLWFEIAQSVGRAGVRKLLILNSHGGQGGVARIVVQDVRIRLNMLAVAANTYALSDPPPALPSEELRHGIHAGAIESALMLHLQPDQVRREHFADFAAASMAQESRDAVLRTHGPTTIGWATQDLHPSGACGDARLATTDMGQHILQQAAHRLVELLTDMSAYPLTALQDGPLER